MSSSREGINPLRPYYTPRPSGLTPDPLFSATSAGLDKPSRSIPLPSASSAKASLSSSAREIFSDLDYSEYLSDASPSASEVSKRLLDQAIWRYTSVLIAQPFEVAKTILQVHLATSRHLAQTSARSPSPSRYQGVNEQRYDDEVRPVLYPFSTHALTDHDSTTPQIPTRMYPPTLLLMRLRRQYPLSASIRVVPAHSVVPSRHPHSLPPQILHPAGPSLRDQKSSPFRTPPPYLRLSHKSGLKKEHLASGKALTRHSSTPFSSRPSSPGRVPSSPLSLTSPIQVFSMVVLTFSNPLSLWPPLGS